MDKIIIFVVLSVLIVIVSWRTLLNYKTHGFYRFISWECIAWLISSKYKVWVIDSFFNPADIFLDFSCHLQYIWLLPE